MHRFFAKLTKVSTNSFYQKFSLTFSILYLTRNGLLEPLGQSQIFPYIRNLASNFSISVITFEKADDLHNKLLRAKVLRDCDYLKINWVCLNFRAFPTPWVQSFAIFQLIYFSLVQCYALRMPNLIHARSYVPAGIALLLNKLLGIPFIFDMRALWPEELITAGRIRRSSISHRLLILVEELCLRHADVVITLTYAAKSYLRSQYPQALATKPVVVIPTCVDLDRFHSTPIPDSNPLIIGCIGTVLSGWFLLDWLTAFFEAIANLDATVSFELLTRDCAKSVNDALCLGDSLQHRLTIQSVLPQDIPAAINRHSASAMFYAGGEISELGRSPTRLAEVLASGRPVIANAGVGDLESIVSQHNVGVITRSKAQADMTHAASQLLQLLKDPLLPNRCRETAESFFSLKNGSSAFSDVYSYCISNHDPSSLPTSST